MTKIAIVRGLNRADESQQRAANLTARQYIPFSELSRGEFRLHLFYKELTAYKQLYPELSNLINPALATIENTLYGSLHRGSFRDPNTAGNPFLKQAVALRQWGRRKTDPASGNGFATRPSVARIGDLIIPERDCSKPIPEPPGGYASIPPQGWQQWAATGRPECEAQKKFEKVINDYLEKSSPHVLYEFVANPNQTTPTVAAKAVLHKGAVSTMNAIGKWQRADLTEWLRLGIKLGNGKAGNGMVGPEDSILAMRQYPDAKVNGLTLALLIVFVEKVLIPAIAITIKLIGAIKQAKPYDPLADQIANFQGYGTRAFSGEPGDWAGSGNYGGTGGSLSNFFNENKEIIIGGGVLLALALTSEK